MRVRGTVVAVDRTNNWALVTPATAASRPDAGGLRAMGAPIKCGLRDGQWPPPYSKVWIESHSSSDYQIVGSISDRRLLVHDDFTHVDSGKAVANGDTPWRGTNLVGSGSSQQTGVGQGVYILVTPATAGASQCAAKDNQSVLVTDDPALWFSAKICTSVPTNCIVRCGFGALDANLNATGGNAADRTAEYQFDSIDGSSKFRSTNGLSVTDQLVPHVPAINVFFDLDIVCVGGGYVGGWINGDGPYVITTNAPAVGGSFEPYFGIYPRAAIQQDIRVDWIHAESFTDPVPAQLAFR